jgi:hypothetical protein
MLGCRCCRDFREELAGLSAATFVIEDGHIIMVRRRSFCWMRQGTGLSIRCFQLDISFLVGG